MAKSTQEDLLYLSSSFSKILKRSFGKGPETCSVSYKNNRLYVYMRKFITPAEEVLVENKSVNLAAMFRGAVINAVTEKFIPEVSKVLGMKVDHFYHDWNYHTNTGILLLEDGRNDEDLAIRDSILEDHLFKVIRHVSSHFHKVPSSIRVVKFTQNFCAVECKKVLLYLESYLYENRNKDLLIKLSNEIKRGYTKYRNLFEDIFNRIIEDLFILWDYENDRNYLIFNFNKDYTTHP